MTRAQGFIMLVKLTVLLGFTGIGLLAAYHIRSGWFSYRKEHESFWNEDMKTGLGLFVLLVIALAFVWVMSLPEALPAQ